MLDIADKYADQVNIMRANMLMNIEKYKYAEYDNLSEYVPKKNTWMGLDFVSLNGEGEVKGYIFFAIGRPNYNFGMKSVGSSGYNMMPDFRLAIDKVFREYKANKISFSVLVGNPAEVLYDRFIDSLGGRIVGYREKHECNLINELCDVKIYEIMRSNYMDKMGELK
jgi:hypothetical protein